MISLGIPDVVVAGDSFALIAVPLLVLHTTGSVAQMGLLTGVASAASVVSGCSPVSWSTGWTAGAC